MGISPEKLQDDLHTKKFGRSTVFAREIRSTNDLAKELALCGASEGTVVLASKQTAGRGRLDREWFSPEGGLWLSVILRPPLQADQAVGLVFAAGLAVAETLYEEYGFDVEVRWPNDVLINGKKVCGILSEMNTARDRVNFVVLGIGINANINVKDVFPEKLRETATSLKKELKHKIKLERLFGTLLTRFEDSYHAYLKEGRTSILQQWKKHAVFLGKEVQVTDCKESWVGIALDVDVNGGLILGLEDGTTKRLVVGDVSLKVREKLD